MYLEGELDSLGVLVASALIVAWESVPVWFLLVGLASYLFRLGTWSRRRRGLPVRGQRTHTNARTRKGPAKAIAGKKKAVK